MQDYYKEQGIININCETIGYDYGYHIITQLLELDKSLPHNQDIIILINTRGSEIYNALSILSIMDNIKLHRDITTIAIGAAKSGGFKILINGTKGKRFATDNSIMMFHDQQLNATALGFQSLDSRLPISFIRNKLDEDIILSNTLIKILSKNSNLSTKKIKSMIDKNIYYDSESALKYGFIDVIGMPKSLNFIKVDNDKKKYNLQSLLKVS